MNEKQWVLGTALGDALISVRDRVGLMRMSFGNPESIGTVANDQMASLLVSCLCKQSSTFLDVGAHIGSVSAAVLRRDRSVRVEAVEAMPDKVAKLRRKFPGIKVHGYAAGDSEGEVTFFVNTRQSGYSSLGKPGGVGDAITPILVSMKTLDSLIDATDVDVIKIDVEGAELGALRGASRILADSRPTVMFESAPGDANGLGYTKEALWEFFAAIDYEIVLPNRLAHLGAGLTQPGFLESHVYPRRSTNYFAVASERRDELRDRARKALSIAPARA